MLFIGDRIKTARRNIGYTKVQLGKLIGVSDSMIGKFERNEREPSARRVAQLAWVLNVSADYLLGVKVSESNRIYFDVKDVPEEDVNLILSVANEMKKLAKTALK